MGSEGSARLGVGVLIIFRSLLGLRRASRLGVLIGLGLIEFSKAGFFDTRDGIFEIADRFTHRIPKFGEATRPEDDEDDGEDD